MSQYLFGHQRQALTFIRSSSWIRLTGLDSPIHLKGAKGKKHNGNGGDAVRKYC
jgi:hypothetical protein